MFSHTYRNLSETKTIEAFLATAKRASQDVQDSTY